MWQTEPSVNTHLASPSIPLGLSSVDDDFRFQILDDDELVPSLVPDDQVCTWAWVIVAGIRIGVVWACQSNATGFLPNPTADGVGADFDVQWIITTRRLFTEGSRTGRPVSFQTVLLQLSHASEMFSLGTGALTVSELRTLLNLKILTP